MPRPRKLRYVLGEAPVRYYKPQGIPLNDLSEVLLSLDGLEALRLADAENRDQTEAAALMGISRPTFSRLLREARLAVATALSQGSALRIDGGPVVVGGDVRDCPRGDRVRHRHRARAHAPMAAEADGRAKDGENRCRRLMICEGTEEAAAIAMGAARGVKASGAAACGGWTSPTLRRGRMNRRELPSPHCVFRRRRRLC